MQWTPSASVVLRRVFAALAVCLCGCSRGGSDEPPGRITVNQEQSRLQIRLDRSAFTLRREGAGLKLVTTPCFTRSAAALVTDFHLQPGDTFTSEPDHHINTSFELLEMGSERARFRYVHRHVPPGPASDRTEDRGEINLPYRHRVLFFPTREIAQAAAVDALQRGGAPLEELAIDLATAYLDRTACTSWSVRIPRLVASASDTQAARAGGTWVVRLDMTTGTSVANSDD